MDDLGYQAFDCDNHYYESPDAFTRHLDPKHAPRCVQWAEIEGRKYHVVGGSISRAVVNPTFNPVGKPGVLRDFFRGNPGGRSPIEMLRDREPLRPEYHDRVARLARMDEFGLDSVWLFPTLGMLYEEQLKRDPEAVCLTFRAFNQWLEEDWGFAFENRIHAAPYISLADPNWACEELDWALERGATTIVMRAAAPWTVKGPVPPTHTIFDPFWARVQEAGITVVIHAGDTGYSQNGYDGDEFSTAMGSMAPSVKSFAIERAALDYLITLIFHRLFERFPGVRVASVENGSEFLPDMFRKLASTARRTGGWFANDPVETFRHHVWINPFWEDNSYDVLELMGPERVIFGSDWPHIEGMPRPLDYLSEIKEVDDETRKLVMRDNTLALNARNPNWR